LKTTQWTIGRQIGLLHGILHGTFTDLHGLRLFQLMPKRVSGYAQKRVFNTRF
jgi:hypothetical protein